MVLFSLILGVSAYALTLESHCQKITIKSPKAELLSISSEKCKTAKILKSSNVVFFTPSISPTEYVVLKRKTDDAFFCKMPFDYLSLHGDLKINEKKTWNSKDDFSSLVQMTNEGGMIRRDEVRSRKQKLNLCSAFPSFFKVRIVPKGVMSKSLTAMKNGGYLMLSSRFSSLYFFNPKLNKIEFVFHIPGDGQILDAIIRKNGDLIVMSSYGDDLIDQEMNYCIDRWDLITGTLIKSRCGFKSYTQQLLLDRNKVTRAYLQNNALYFEEFNENFEFKTMQIIKDVKSFDLNTAFVSEN